MFYTERKQIWRVRPTNGAGEIWNGIRLGLCPADQGSVGRLLRAHQRAGPRFILNGGEAIDQKTGLIWKRCSLEAIQFARTEGAGWHVPSGRPT